MDSKVVLDSVVLDLPIQETIPYLVGNSRRSFFTSTMYTEPLPILFMHTLPAPLDQGKMHM